jgi:hypothetical protein
MWDYQVLPPAARVAMCQEYVKQCWEKESDEVKREITEEANKQYEAAMQDFRGDNKVPEQSTEEYHE